MKVRNKLAILYILIFALLASAAYAKSFTDVLGESFVLINDFFKNENYKPYSLIIDFFVFSVVFMAIYMRGIKFAFKEVTKTEKALAVILGLTTAFLLIIGGYSIQKLLPFVPWLLFFLLFTLIWWLLKDMKSKGGRFLLALLLTLLLLLIFFTLFSATSYRISCPEKALPWLPWLLALLLFILFWFLLKDIKNAFGRFLLALLLTVTVVLLILFLLNTFSKELGCPEGPFATSLIGDVGDSFKRMEIGSAFGGFGSGSGPSLAPLQQVKPPEKPAVQGSKVAEIFEVYPKDFTNQEAFDKVLKERGEKGTDVGGKKYFRNKDGKLIVNGQEVPEKEHQKILEEKNKAKPAGAAPPKGSSWSTGSIIGIVVLLLVLALGGILAIRRFGLFGIGGQHGSIYGGTPKEGEIYYFIQEIESISKEKEERIMAIRTTQDEKNKILQMGENKQRIIGELAKASIANLWTVEGRKLIREEEYKILPELLEKEERVRRQLNALKITENNFLKSERFRSLATDNYQRAMANLVNRKTESLETMGIVPLVGIFDGFERAEIAIEQELESIEQEKKIKELVHGKFKTVQADWDKLEKYGRHEDTIVKLLELKVKKQKAALQFLKEKLSNRDQEDSSQADEAAQKGSKVVKIQKPTKRAAAKKEDKGQEMPKAA